MVELKVVRQKEGVELMQNEICKLCGKPMFPKFQMGGQVNGSELPMNTPLTSNIGYWHCEGCDVYVFRAEYVAGKSKLFHKRINWAMDGLMKKRWQFWK
jgi:hypothetical protein